MSLAKIVHILLMLVGIVIIGLCIGGISNAQLPLAVHLFIVILVLVLFVFCLVLLRVFLERKRNGAKNNYDVTDGGKVNKGFHAAEEGTSKAVTAGQSKAIAGDDKWVANYVPYGNYPKGKAQEQEDTVDSKWEKNYVAYKEKGEDDAGEKDNKE